MKRIIALIILSLMFVADDHSKAQARDPLLSPAKQTALVRGVITDFLTGAGVPRAEVVFESDERMETVLSAKDGSYEAQLPIDVYRISVRRMTYCSSRRAAVQIEPWPETKFHFTLVPCATQHVGLLKDGRYHTEVAREVNPLDFDSLKVPSSKGELLIRFGAKQQNQRVVVYDGATIKYLFSAGNLKELRDEYKYLGVMLSYGLLTVYGDKVKLTKNTFEIDVQGNVVVDNGRKRTQANAVRIRFAGDKPIVEFIR